MIINPLLKEEEIEREKGTIIEEINFYEDTPYRKINDYFDGLLYQDNPLGFEIIGTKENIKNANRNTFLQYIQNLYQPQNTVLVVAGGLENKQQQFLKQIKQKLANWQNLGTIKSYPKIKENQRQPQVLIKSKNTEQSHFCLGYRTFSFFDEQKYALSILAAILGGGMSSRLFMQIRERRGLCYYISTQREHYADTGNLFTQAGIVNDLVKIKDALKLIFQEQAKIAQGDLTEDEIVKAKELVKGRLLINLEDSSSAANFFATKYLLEKKITPPDEVINKLEAVTKKELQQLAQKIFKNQNLNFALIGPFSDKDFSPSDFISL